MDMLRHRSHGGPGLNFETVEVPKEPQVVKDEKPDTAAAAPSLKSLLADKDKLDADLDKKIEAKTSPKAADQLS